MLSGQTTGNIRSSQRRITGLMLGTSGVNWVLDADIRGFLNVVNHEWLVRFVDHRIADQRVVRLIQKWLNACVVLKDG